MFYAQSNDFAARNSQLFDFIHTSSAALWNLRWQVQGFVQVRPEASSGELSDRFTSGTDIRANNLKGTCIDTSWEDQLGQFAQIISTNLIAMYEGWAEEVTGILGHKSLAKSIQFPSKGTYGRTDDGAREAIVKIKRNGISGDMEKAFHPAYSKQQKYSFVNLDSLLALYRYHKETRNAVMHRGGVADQRTETAWRHASTISQTDIGGRSAPILSPVADGYPVKIDIRAAIQLSDVLLRLVTTIDAELCFTELAEKMFVTGWKSNENSLARRELPGDPTRREKRLAQIARKAGYVNPSDVEAVRSIGLRAGLLRP
ncbi:hypothetical protein [Streptomyces sp. NPDC004270]